MATKTDVAQIHTRINGVESRVKVIEDKSVEEKAVTAFTDRIKRNAGWVVAGVIVPVASIVVTYVLTLH